MPNHKCGVRQETCSKGSSLGEVYCIGCAAGDDGCAPGAGAVLVLCRSLAVFIFTDLHESSADLTRIFDSDILQDSRIHHVRYRSTATIVVV